MRLILQNVTDVEYQVQKRREALAKQKSTLQPIPVFVGRSISEVESSYIVINENRYVCPSPLYAFHLAFISFFVLHAQYPEAAQQVWLAIQWIFYDIRRKDDNPTGSLFSYAKQLKK